MGELVDIQSYQKRYDGELRRVNKAQISESNRKIILSFNRYILIDMFLDECKETYNKTKKQ